MKQEIVLKGFAIVVVTRGFIYVGDVVYDDQWCIVTNARNLRRWGTTKGLGELALNGPTGETGLDNVGIVRIPHHAVIHIIDTEAEKWD